MCGELHRETSSWLTVAVDASQRLTTTTTTTTTTATEKFDTDRLDCAQFGSHYANLHGNALYLFLQLQLPQSYCVVRQLALRRRQLSGSNTDRATNQTFETRARGSDLDSAFRAFRARTRVVTIAPQFNTPPYVAFNLPAAVDCRRTGPEVRISSTGGRRSTERRF